LKSFGSGFFVIPKPFRKAEEWITEKVGPKLEDVE
jgi:hypothetical protein